MFVARKARFRAQPETASTAPPCYSDSELATTSAFSRTNAARTRAVKAPRLKPNRKILEPLIKQRDRVRVGADLHRIVLAGEIFRVIEGEAEDPLAIWVFLVIVLAAIGVHGLGPNRRRGRRLVRARISPTEPPSPVVRQFFRPRGVWHQQEQISKRNPRWTAKISCHRCDQRFVPSSEHFTLLSNGMIDVPDVSGR